MADVLPAKPCVYYQEYRCTIQNRHICIIEKKETWVLCGSNFYKALLFSYFMLYIPLWICYTSNKYYRRHVFCLKTRKG